MPSPSRISRIAVGDVLVLAADQARALLDHRHLGAEAAEHLRELEPDVAAADDDQVAGQRVEREHRAVGEVGDVVRRPGRSGTAARPPTLMKMRVGGERSSPTLTVRGPVEAGVAAEHGAALHAAAASSRARARASPTIASLARLDRGHVDADRPPMRDAVVGGAAGEMRGVGAGDQRLGRACSRC